jgi:hypothetical protein
MSRICQRVAKSDSIGNNLTVQNTLSTVAPGMAINGLNFVVFGSVAFSLLMALLFAVTRGSSDSLYDQIGQGGLSGDGGPSSIGGPAAPALDSPIGRVEQEREIRQMLGARNARLVRSGKPALDIDAEVARLLESAAPQAHDAGLTDEVRQLVVARNERRLRKGLDPLDVEAEVARTLAELEP